MNRQRGVATLLITSTLLLVVGLASVSVTKQSITEQKIARNNYYNAQAFQAAEAGLEYASAYLNKNYSTIIASQSGGYINYNISTKTLPNSATYTITYTNPTKNNYDLLNISSIGKSADGTAIRNVTQAFQQSSSDFYTANAKGDVIVKGNGNNVYGPYAINAGGNVNSKASVNGMVLSNNQAIHNLSNSNFFAYFTCDSFSEYQNDCMNNNKHGHGKCGSNHSSSNCTYQSNSNGVNWNSLSGNIWINSNVSLSGQTTIGSQSEPVFFIVNGNLTGTGNAKIYGVAYVMGNVDLRGNAKIEGVLITTGDIIFRGNGSVVNNSTIAQSILSSCTTATAGGSGGYAKVPGTWRDF